MDKQAEQIYQICIPHTYRDYFDYHVNGPLSPGIGIRVWVPFRNQTRLGLVIGKHTQSPHTELKSVSSIIDTEPLLTQNMLNFFKWVASYYQSPLSEIIPLAIPKNYRLGNKSELPLRCYYRLMLDVERAHSLIPSRAHKQHALINFLADTGATDKKTLLQKGFTHAQLDHLIKLNILAIKNEVSIPQSNSTLSPPLILNAEQDVAVQTICRQLHHYHCFLLQGITGSGKTEVYLQVIAQVLAQGKQVLVLVPEIGLTPQLLSRFTARFAEPMAVIHSNLNERERQSTWQLAKDNLVKLVIGTRTAIFTPMPELGLIVIDEEHDPSLKQMEGVRYSARDTALMRAHMEGIPIILGSATPSLESLYNCMQAKYSLLRLNQRALSKSPLHYQIIDIRNTPLQHGLAAKTLNTIAEHLQQNNQVMVFINRRGFAPVLLCHHCGWMADCPACDSHLTLHRQMGRLVCHHCGLTTIIPGHCRTCHSQELLPIGAGTQRIHEYLSNHFPNINLLRVDRDEVRKKNALDNHLERIHRGEAQLIVGTQMLAKGHHFPRLTLVVVVDTDAGFYNQDFRALERLGQLLTQVSGRAGRAERPGQVLIQSHLPHHPLLNLLIQQGYDSFAQALLTLRQQADLPPYRFLALIRAQDKSAKKVLDFLHLLKEQLVLHEVTTLGPAPAPLARRANQHRMQLLIKASSRKILQTRLTQLRQWLTMNKLTNHVRWNVDIDPMDLS
ncbi:Primosomal protein N' (replication factor Y) [Legionella lansingensis]|uniref:Replication restart protein PriA n=1 Tax=Legionella lansingensis TaxID=45067 RepID=A0A0W0VLD4_9GAMM|nr:primosomal protein N' [Legionella lansingensis]KTD20899.1 Primosomal protein N' (replication factor Y) [Legionella lansingensis]SNV43885.1 Primosomal protein N' (replication factor Y) [Legionella lansingensis]